LDPDYNTFAGGFVSIILIFLLMSVFFNSWMALLNKTDISSTTEVIREFDPSYMNFNTNDLMFAIGVNGINFTDNSFQKYFNLSMKKVEKIKG
jgi:divalent metal cation (Fe/Co/Zn/Cd) transporter